MRIDKQASSSASLGSDDDLEVHLMLRCAEVYALLGDLTKASVNSFKPGRHLHSLRSSSYDEARAAEDVIGRADSSGSSRSRMCLKVQSLERAAIAANVLAVILLCQVRA